MSAVNEKIVKIKKNPNFLKICKIVEFLSYVFIFSQMILNLGYAGEALAQTHKDHYFGIAVIFFLISLLILQRIKLLNWVYIPVIVIICIIAWRMLIPLESMPHLYNVARVRWIAGGLMGILCIDMIMFKKVALVKERELWPTLLWLVLAVGAFVISGGACYSYVVFLPICCLYLLRVDKHSYQKWIFALSVGYYIAFLYTMVKSFIMVPYTGERYYGIYINHGLFGIFIGGAFICALWWLLLIVKRKTPLWLRILATIPVGTVLICNVMNGARVGEFAVLAVAAVVICIWGGKTSKKNIIFRLSTLSIAVCIFLVLGFILMYILSTYDEETLQLIVDNDILREKILYWCRKSHQVFGAESRYGIIEGGTIWNAIDQFSSGRLSHWMVYLQHTGMKPATDFAIDIGGFVMPHPHNTYIYWLYGMGLIPGILLIVWTLFYLLRSIVELTRKNNICLFSFLWLIYYLLVGINENPVWITPVPFILMMAYYPLMIKMKDKDIEKKKGKING